MKDKTVDKRGTGGVTSIALSSVLKDALECLSKREGLSKGAIVRSALREFFERHDRWVEPEGRLIG